MQLIKTIAINCGMTWDSVVMISGIIAKDLPPGAPAVHRDVSAGHFLLLSISGTDPSRPAAPPSVTVGQKRRYMTRMVHDHGEASKSGRAKRGKRDEFSGSWG